MKKLTVIACLSTTLLASGAAQADWRGNWLLGISGGHSWFTGNFHHISDIDIPVDLPPLEFQHPFKNKGWMWGVLGGYQIRYNEWLLGAELNVDWQNGHHTQNYSELANFLGGALDVGFSTSAKYKRDATYGLTARVGYEVLPCFIPYLRAGVERAHDKLHVIAGVISTPVLDVEASNHSYRFIGGIGAEAPVPMLTGLTFRAEYNYHTSKELDAAAPWSNPLITAEVGAKRFINTLKASLVYNFTI